MTQEISEKIYNRDIQPIDLYVKKIDKEMLKMAGFFNFKTLVCDGDIERDPTLPAITIFKYKYNPERDFKGPLVKISIDNFERLSDYIKNHPNKVQGIIIDFNEFRGNKINYLTLNFKLTFFEKHGIPLIFGSGANSASQIVPPATLKAAVKYLTPIKDPDNSKIYKKFYNNLMEILTQGKYFETH